MRTFQYFLFLLAYSPMLYAQSDPFQKEPWNNNYPMVIDAYYANLINYDRLKTEGRVSGIIFKSSEGLNADPGYAASIKKAKDYGLLVGSYHLGKRGNPEKQADFYLEQIGISGTDDLVALDIEGIGVNDITLTEAEIFIKRIYEKTGRYPLLYCNNLVLEEISRRYDKNSVFAQCPLWYARFRNTLPSLNTRVWDKVSLWQFACEINCKGENGNDKPGCPIRIAGTKNDMDVNVFNGTLEELKTFWKTTGKTQNQSGGSISTYLQQSFKKSILRTTPILIGDYCGSKAYFVQGFNADGKLKERQIVFEKEGVFTSSNRFFFWCEEQPLINYTHQNQTYETQEDLENLIITYSEEDGGKFLVQDALSIQIQKEAVDNEEHIGASGRQYVSFQDFIKENKCKNL